MDSISVMKEAVRILEDKKAVDIEVIDINKLTSLADYFIICSGTSSTHIKAMADELEKGMELAGNKCLRKEGYESAKWILIDFGDVIVHIFQQDYREFYDIERIWSDGIMFKH